MPGYVKMRCAQSGIVSISPRALAIKARGAAAALLQFSSARQMLREQRLHKKQIDGLLRSVNSTLGGWTDYSAPGETW